MPASTRNMKIKWTNNHNQMLCTFKASTYGKERNKFRNAQHSSTFLLPQSCSGMPIAEDPARGLQHTPRCCTGDWKLEKSALILALVIPLQLPSGCLQLIKASGSAECNISQSPVIYEADAYLLCNIIYFWEHKLAQKSLRFFPIAWNEVFGECMPSCISYGAVTKDMVV